MFGAANGVVDHRARRSAAGAVPAPPATAAWSAASRGRRRSARPLAPFALAFAIDRWSDRAALEILIAAALLALCCFMAIRRPA